MYYPRETGNKDYVKFWGVNKVHYGLGEKSELTKINSLRCTRLEWSLLCSSKSFSSSSSRKFQLLLKDSKIIWEDEFYLYSAGHLDKVDQ